MKKYIPIATIIFLFVLTMFLVGCTTKEVVYVPQSTTTSSSTTTTSPTTTTMWITAPPTTLPAFDPVAMFLNDVYSNTDLEYTLSDSEMIDLGRTTCEYLGSGFTGSDVIDIILEAGQESGSTQKEMLDYASLSGLAVGYLCPEYSYKL